MPELPEVETIRRSLLPLLTGLTIGGSEIFLPKLLRNTSPEEFSAQILGRSILDILRRGKYLVFKLSEGNTLVVHLRMTGQLRFCLSDTARLPHTHIILRFTQGSELRYTDMRQFGFWFLASDDEIERVARLESLGVEPLSPDFTVNTFVNLLKGHRGRIKTVLLDQHLVAGIGNIYADEALFAAGIHPERMPCRLQTAEVEKLHAALQMVLRKGIELRGATVRDYVDGSGAAGGFQQVIKVYGRKGLPCYSCTTSIVRSVVAGRGTHFCPRCQN